MDPARTKLIACEVVLKEIAHEVPTGVEVQSVEVAWHARPESLNKLLQSAIDDSSPEFETIILGYGLCSRSVDGLHSRSSSLVIPRVHDCIGLLLNGCDERVNGSGAEAGTYYLSKGWIESGDHLWAEFDRMSDQFGEARARRLIDTMLKNYTRVAFIRTGADPKHKDYLDFSRRFAEFFGLRFEEIAGSKRLMRQMIRGPWDDDFIVVSPGQAIDFLGFLSS